MNGIQEVSGSIPLISTNSNRLQGALCSLLLYYHLKFAGPCGKRANRIIRNPPGRREWLITITQVLYVLEVAGCLSISQAAQRLYVSQSALSQQILKLEDELGYPLFVRTARGMRMTDAGARFCREARPAADAWQQLCHSILPAGKRNRRKLRIVVGPRVYSNRLFQDIVSFFDGHGEIDVAFVTEAGCDYVSGLRNRNIDLALDCVLSEDQKTDDLYSCALIWERQCVLMAPDDLRAELPALSFYDLQGSAMISGLEGSAEEKMLRNTCRKFHITFSRVYRSDGITTNMDLVRSGTAVGLGPQSFASYYQVSAVPLSPETMTSLDFICLKSSIRRKDIQQFRDHLLAVCMERRKGSAGTAQPPD